LFTGFEYRGLALASDCKTIEQCVNQCVGKKQYLIEQFKNRLA